MPLHLALNPTAQCEPRRISQVEGCYWLLVPLSLEWPKATKSLTNIPNVDLGFMGMIRRFPPTKPSAFGPPCNVGTCLCGIFSPCGTVSPWRRCSTTASAVGMYFSAEVPFYGLCFNRVLPFMAACRSYVPSVASAYLRTLYCLCLNLNVPQLSIPRLFEPRLCLARIRNTRGICLRSCLSNLRNAHLLSFHHHPPLCYLIPACATARLAYSRRPPLKTRCLIFREMLA